MMMVNLTINNKKISVEDGTTILEAAKQNNILIPTMCYLEDVHKFGSCRICVVEQEGAKNLQASCITPVTEGMVIHTNTKRVRVREK
jgi:NADH-quinone oxidoreductase subunit G/NADP-reducing hydrogenase subunit HndD